MYESAISALKNGEPELAIQEIHRIMTMKANPHQLELMAESVKDEIVSSTDFLERKGWIA